MPDHHGTDLERLIALSLGELPEDEAAALRARLDREPGLADLADTIASLGAFLKAEPGAVPSESAVRSAHSLLRESKPGITERAADGVRRIVAALTLDTRLTPAIEGIRGAGERAALAFECDEADIDLEITPETSGEAWTLRAQLDADEGEDWTPEITDRASGAVIALASGEDGACVATLPAGSYTVRFSREGVSIEAGPVQIP